MESDGAGGSDAAWIAVRVPEGDIELVHAHLAGKAEGDGGIEAPVDFLLTIGVGGRETPCGLLEALGLDRDGIADRVGAIEGPGELVDRVGAALEPDGEEGLGSARGSGDLAAVLGGVGQGRFAVDVLACGDAVEGDLRVQVRWGGDHDGLKVLRGREHGGVAGVGGGASGAACAAACA